MANKLEKQNRIKILKSSAQLLKNLTLGIYFRESASWNINDFSFKFYFGGTIINELYNFVLYNLRELHLLHYELDDSWIIITFEIFWNIEEE